MFTRPWLGQVPLILGPSSWGAGGIPFVQEVAANPPFWGEWGYVQDGEVVDSGRVGPFDTIQEAFSAAAKAAGEAGATELPLDGFAQVKDSQDQAVGPVT